MTPWCPRRIETIEAGDYVLGVDKKGKTHMTKVHSAFVTENYLVEIETDSGRLTTTGKQPLCLACGCCKTAGELVIGDEMLRWENGEVRPTKVQAINRTGRLVQVFNLVLEDQDFYISGGLQVQQAPRDPGSDRAGVAGGRGGAAAIDEETVPPKDAGSHEGRFDAGSPLLSHAEFLRSASHVAAAWFARKVEV